MSESWDVPDSETNVGDKTWFVDGEGIKVRRECGGEMKVEMWVPRETFIEAWQKYIPCINKA